MEITVRKSFIKELQKLPSKIQQSVREILEDLEQADDLESSGVDYKYMEGQKKSQNYYRIRVGGWRMGIEYNPPIDEQMAATLIITILSRGDIYKKFPPK
ncbi:type II toxin-antitoxin system toxin RelE3 [Spirosoma migulaei]